MKTLSVQIVINVPQRPSQCVSRQTVFRANHAAKAKHVSRVQDGDGETCFECAGRRRGNVFRACKAAKASGRALELMLDFFACERGLRNIQKLRCLTRRALFFERVGNQLFSCSSMILLKSRLSSRRTSRLRSIMLSLYTLTFRSSSTASSPICRSRSLM